MTETAISPADLNSHEFDIPCEACGRPAIVMSKGCNDPRHFAICQRHFDLLRKNFEERLHSICTGCNRPWMHLETHYDLVVI